jgi:glycosyltransferase involved in cell wall biosynthesis
MRHGRTPPFPDPSSPNRFKQWPKAKQGEAPAWPNPQKGSPLQPEGRPITVRAHRHKGAVLTALAIRLARQAWRNLPMEVRRIVGQRLLHAAMPVMAYSLPKARAFALRADGAASVLGVFQAALGHGSAARLLMLELQAAGISTAALDVTALVGAEVNDTRPLAADAGAEAKGPLILAVNPDTAIVALAAQRSLLTERPVIGYFVWELERAPPAWARIGPALHALWSPSRFSAIGLEALFKRPVLTAPHPAALAPPPSPTPEARARGRARIAAAPDDFVVISSFSVTSSLARKNPFAAIAAFESAFGADPTRRLVLRCLGGTRFPAALETLRAAVREAKATVTLIESNGDLAELYDLYAACDALISLHRSEGFGLNLAEAMLSERAVIATGWSGNVEFMDAQSAALVDHTLVPVKDPQGIYRMKGARWAEPSHDQAVAHLRRLADDADFRVGLAQRGAAMARARLSGGAAAEALKQWTAP